MMGTGLKKCRPTNLFCLSGEVAVIISVIESEEVFEARMVSGLHSSSSCRKVSRLRSKFSTMASMMMSQSESSASEVVPRIRPRISSRFSGVMVPFSANLARDFSMPPKPRSHSSSDVSRTTTSKPAVAAVCAMPDPIRPQPSTPTFLISMKFLLL
jgi:hypothetical protein